MPLSSDSKLRIAQESFARGERFSTLLGRNQRKTKKRTRQIPM